jgi:hypothetical protein
LATLYGVALLAGIGFTMSLFIGTLARDTADHAVPLRLGVLSGSLLSGVGGYIVLRGHAAFAGQPMTRDVTRFVKAGDVVVDVRMRCRWARLRLPRGTTHRAGGVLLAAQPPCRCLE